MPYQRDPNYIEVAERVAIFHSATDGLGSLQPRDPDHPVQVLELTDVDPDTGLVRPATFLVYTAVAYRHPNDERPGIGVAYERFPGATPYTRDSELMNAETSAWGRAIVATGLGQTNRGIASAEEVRARQQRDAMASAASLASVAWWMHQALVAGVPVDAERAERLMSHARESDKHASEVVERLSKAMQQARDDTTDSDGSATVDASA